MNIKVYCFMVGRFIGKAKMMDSLGSHKLKLLTYLVTKIMNLTTKRSFNLKISTFNRINGGFHTNKQGLKKVKLMGLESWSS